ncbi:MAG: hypothetical protein ACRD3W_28800 [Terriglobales bacterium]
MYPSVRVKKQFVAPLAALSLAILTAAPPACAYYSLNYLPYQLGGYLLYPMRSLFYAPYTFLPGRFGSYANQQTQASYRVPFSGNSPVLEQQYTDPEPVGEPRQRNRPQRAGFFAKDQVSSAQWTNRNSNGQDPNAATAPAAGAPPVAPQRGGTAVASAQGAPGAHGAAASAAAPPAMAAAPNAPLASGFINSVNDRFDGDLGKALFDPGTRGWAKALGLIDNDAMFTSDFSAERTDVMRKILRDPGLDPLSKLDTLRILLRGSSNIQR